MENRDRHCPAGIRGYRDIEVHDAGRNVPSVLDYEVVAVDSRPIITSPAMAALCPST